MVFRYVVGLCLLLAASAVCGNELQVDYLGQLPEYDVLEGEPVTYKFKNTNIDDGIGQASDRIGTGMQIRVDGTLITPGSGIFSSSDINGDTLDDCDEDPSFPNTWRCGDLVEAGRSQTYSFTWTPPQAGTYVVDFLAFCQEIPIPNPPRYCDVNGNEGGTGTVAYITTEVDIDTDSDGVGNANDPDDDNDGIADGLDTYPLTPSNLCTGGDFDYATLGIPVVDDLTCAARVSIHVYGTTEVMGPPAHLHLIAPTLRFDVGFLVADGGLLSVISTNPCPGCGGYEIGDQGPAGGIVFYVTDGGWHGLEAAPVDQSAGVPWGCFGTSITGAAGSDIGTGAQNTTAILEQCGERPIAASVAFNYSLNGYDDWFLPSSTELYVMFTHLGPSASGDLVYDFYWSSKQRAGDTDDAHARRGGGFSYQTKTVDNRVRAIRAF